MGKVLYTAEAKVSGGRIDGHGRTSDGALDVSLGIPTELGGPGGKTNPEQLFAVGYASCFESALGTVARRAKVETGETSIDSKVNLFSNPDGSFGLSVELHVTLPGLENPEASELVAKAHEVCPYSNATRGNIEVELFANGEKVGE